MGKRSYKFRIYPTKDQSERLAYALELLRDFYNAALQERRDAWSLNRTRITFHSQCKQVADIRKLNTDYMRVHARTMMRTLMQLDRTFQAFFRRVKNGERPGCPRFKQQQAFNTFFYNQSGFKWKGSRFSVSLLGDFKIKQHRPVEGQIKEVQLKREGFRWYAVLVCDGVPDKPLAATGRFVGIDVGIESFATLSDGTQVENSRFYESSAKRLRTAQRRVCRRKKGSERRRKAIAQLRSIHQKIFNQRTDFQHKLSTLLIKEYGLIVVEKLNIAGLAKGRLSKQILDASWHAFIQKLKYKAEDAGRSVVEVCPNFTSQDCSDCGTRVKKGLKVRVHNCENCGLSIHRDWNAALNILRLGQSHQDITYRVAESVS